MNNQRILIGLTWAVSLVIVYFVGGTGSPVQQSPVGDEGRIGRSSSSSTELSPQVILRRVDAGEENPEMSEKANIPMMIAKARMEMGSGMGGVMNMRGMFRAIAPLLELRDSQIQEALAEIDKTMKEPQQKMMFYSILLGLWAEKDGKAALDYAEKNLKGNPILDGGVKSGIIGAWSRTNPEAAWRWFEAEGKSISNERSIMMVVTGVFKETGSGDKKEKTNQQ